MKYVPLRMYSDYSLGFGTSKIKYLVKGLLGKGYTSAALSDLHNMHGYLEWSSESADNGLHPIVSCVINVQLDESNYGEVSLFVKNEIGFRNLCKLLEKAYLHEKASTVSPMIDFNQLSEHKEGLVLITGSHKNGVVTNLLKRRMEQDAIDVLAWLANEFKKDFYIEINRGSIQTRNDKVIEDWFLAFADGSAGAVELDDGTIMERIPIVGTTDIVYGDKESHETYLIIGAVSEKRTLSYGNGMISTNDKNNYSIRSMDEISELFSDIPDAIDNTVSVAVKCAWKGESRKPVLPTYETEKGEDEELRYQAHQGLLRRVKEGKVPENELDIYTERLDFELDTIIKMKFPGYFLIVSDFINWAKNNGIPVGPGRGSGAGSLVAYSLRITNLNPLKYGLLFERFLNPERVSMPDFDIDFCQDRRGEVIQYVQNKYGKESVSYIATFGKIKSKNALKDTARFLSHDDGHHYNFFEMNELTKLIPKKLEDPDPMDLMEAYENSPLFRQKIDESPKFKDLFNLALKIEGVYRSRGAHAAGIIIGDKDLTNYVPVMYDPTVGGNVCQLNMKAAEKAGMVKFDFLGLKNLTIIAMICRLIEQDYGVRIDPDLLEPDDPEVFANIFSTGRTNGVFQFESNGMKDMLKKMKETTFFDTIAGVSLFRPGPMDNIPKYIDVKLGREEAEYPKPSHVTEKILKETNGIMVYQEQVMQVAQAVAGYTLGGADLLRRAMGKKNKEEMDKERSKFIQGAMELYNLKKDEANELFDTINKFAGYGFNKSHAAAYAYVSYQTAFFKHYFPAQFFAALMTYNADKPEKLFHIKEDMEEIGLKLLLPCVNNSYSSFMPEWDDDGWKMPKWPSYIEAPKYNFEKRISVRFGLSAIKSVSSTMGDDIQSVRKQGLFKSLEDFHKRMHEFANKKQMNQLNEAGSFDSLLPKNSLGFANRAGGEAALAHLDKAIKKQSKDKNQIDLFAEDTTQLPREIYNQADWTNRAQREFKAVGFYFNNHPIDTYVDRLKRGGVSRLHSLVQWMEERNIIEKRHHLCVMIDEVYVKTSKNGNNFLVVECSEKGNSYSFVVFDKIAIEDKRQILEGAKESKSPVVIEVDVNAEDEKISVVARNIYLIQDYIDKIRGEITITINVDRMIPMRHENKIKEEGKDISDIMIKRQKDNIFSAVKKHESSDGIPFKIIFKKGNSIIDQYIAESKIKFNTVLENFCKTLDGIESMTEKVPEREQKKTYQKQKIEHDNEDYEDYEQIEVAAKRI